MSIKQGPPKEKGSIWLKETLMAGKESSEVLKQDGRVEDVIQSDLVVKSGLLGGNTFELKEVDGVQVDSN